MDVEKKGPIKIDLSDGIDSREEQTLGLSPDQLKSFKEYLKQKHSKEKL